MNNAIFLFLRLYFEFGFLSLRHLFTSSLLLAYFLHCVPLSVLSWQSWFQTKRKIIRCSNQCKRQDDDSFERNVQIDVLENRKWTNDLWILSSSYFEVQVHGRHQASRLKSLDDSIEGMEMLCWLALFGWSSFWSSFENNICSLLKQMNKTPLVEMLSRRE